MDKDSVSSIIAISIVMAALLAGLAIISSTSCAIQQGTACKYINNNEGE